MILLLVAWLAIALGFSLGLSLPMLCREFFFEIRASGQIAGGFADHDYLKQQKLSEWMNQLVTKNAAFELTKHYS